MQVIATAGHVDHGKSTLIRALTGIEPDRWAEEKRRGLTIDLGFAWTRLPSGRSVSFVDVPGHERFLGNMLAGLGPAPIVLFVVAADEGWREQSDDHRDAVAALGIDRGIIALTRADLAPERVGETTAQVRDELAGTGLADAPIVPVSAVTGDGLPELRAAIGELLADLPAPAAEAPVRMWLDRAFTASGAGAVVTGTLAAGTIHREDRLELLGADEDREVVVRSLQSRGGAVDQIGPTSRVAVNLRGVDADRVGRGDALLTPGAFHRSDLLDVRAMTGADFADAPEEIVVHVGTAAVPARVRPLGAAHARLSLARPLPLMVGDRVVLRGSGEHPVRTGALVLDVDPPRLDRRGDGARRAETLTQMGPTGDVTLEVARRRAVRAADLARFGIVIPEPPPAQVRRVGEWLVDGAALDGWTSALRDTVAAHARQHPLAPGLPAKAAQDALALPDPILLDAVVRASGLEQRDGRIRDPKTVQGMGAAESAIATLEKRLRAEPFAAPEADDLAALKLGPKEIAAAARQGRLLRLDDGVVLLPTAPALAMRELAALPQPFTTSQARQALGTTRRVAIPLLEHLDGRGWTRRLDGTTREVVR
ncbi:selenocysteine-specific translation elongation factor [Brachybacterium timonense]|uniref:selenocysteine-specific translation elongation factor n=1 Tax=Brachybacterium timonense TaxID=2050896 RepID=UPI000D0B9249|nr:selenocysteine-specific translation elongation factor [Brachybacterium timonense]